MTSSSSTDDWSQLLGSQLLDRGEDGKHVRVPATSLQGKVVGIYFSAHWCPPCRQFTPLLANLYTKLKKDDKEFEVVFVSMDRNQAQFSDYFNSMPWLAIPYEDDQLRSVLSRKFRVAGIPCLIILDQDTTILNANAVSVVVSDRSGEHFPWKGMSAPNSRFPPMPWIMLAFLIWWLVNTFLFPARPKQ